MIEVFPHGNGFGWRMISACGRTLLERTGFPCDFSAAGAAKEYRTSFWRVADRIDHRMARAI